MYTITLEIIDGEGESDWLTYEFVVVYDPEGGFVTGGGWFNSPAGACHFEDCTDETSGKANFEALVWNEERASPSCGRSRVPSSSRRLWFTRLQGWQLLRIGPTNKTTSRRSDLAEWREWTVLAKSQFLLLWAVDEARPEFAHGDRIWGGWDW